MEQYTILYEDEDILVADKLGALPVQKDKTKDANLQDLLAAELALRPDVEPLDGKIFLEAAHRVDRRASGAVLFAKTPKALSTLEAAFRNHKVGKEYVACVEREPIPAQGRLEHLLVVDKRTNTSRALPPDIVPPTPTAKKLLESAQKAVLEYRLACRSERYFFMEIRLMTGRHHQIRAQLSAAGTPIRGDLKYGARRSCASGRIMLHAHRISLIQPRTGERIDVTAPFPSDEPLWQVYVDNGIPKADQVQA
jgi:23S rRNA pseudouridine1911/1915/1917 synthase